MRRVPVAIVASSLLVATLVSTASAETGPNAARQEFDRVSASFAFSEGGNDFSGQVLVDRDTLTGASIASFFFSSAGPEVECDNGTPDDPEDDFTAQSLIDFTANEASPATLTIDDKLASAEASAIAQGNLITLEACTDAETSTPTTVVWHLTLAATGQTVRTTTVDHFPNDDGTVTKQTIKIAERPSAGSIAVDDMSLDADGSIMHALIVEQTR
jgi:hypothetical protein